MITFLTNNAIVGWMLFASVMFFLSGVGLTLYFGHKVMQQKRNDYNGSG